MVLIWNQNVVESPLRKLGSRMSTLINSHHRAEGNRWEPPTCSPPCLTAVGGTSQEARFQKAGSRCGGQLVSSCDTPERRRQRAPLLVCRQKTEV